MTRYLVLEAPGGPDRDHVSTRFIADRFSAIAFIAPWLWLPLNRLWAHTLAVFSLLIMAGAIATLSGSGIPVPLCLLVCGLLAGFEGRSMLAGDLEARGWTVRTVIHATDLETAEAIWFATTATAASFTPPLPRAAWAAGQDKNGKRAGWRDDTSGLVGLDFSGGR